MSLGADVSEDPAAGWHLWKSDGGGWYATRLGSRLTDEEMERGLAMTVAGDTRDELDALLRMQAELRHG